MLSSKSTPACPEVATTTAAALTQYSGQVYDPESFITPGMFPKFESSEMIVILCLCMIFFFAGGGGLTLGQNDALTPHHRSKVKLKIFVAPCWRAVAYTGYFIFVI